MLENLKKYINVETITVFQRRNNVSLSMSKFNVETTLILG